MYVHTHLSVVRHQRLTDHGAQQNHLLEDLERGADDAGLARVEGGLRGQDQLSKPCFFVFRPVVHPVLRPAECPTKPCIRGLVWYVVRYLRVMAWRSIRRPAPEAFFLQFPVGERSTPGRCGAGWRRRRQQQQSTNIRR